jgi:hypothetical protein
MNQSKIIIDVDEKTGLFMVLNQVGDPLFKMEKNKLEEWLDWVELQEQIKAKKRPKQF